MRLPQAAVANLKPSVTAVSLSDYSLLRFSGPDAAAFLQGQLTCDVLGLRSATATYGGYCTPKGRLLAVFLLWHDAAGFTMQLPAVLGEALRKRLAMYVLRAKVTVEDLAPLLGCAGAATGAAVTALGGSPAAAVFSVATHNGITAVGLPGPRQLVVLPRARAAALPADAGAWLQSDIAAGVPVILPATQEEFVPQMVNLDCIGALSYSKGCYPGQEIVARTHYLGKLKQRMYRVQVEAQTVQPGDKLYCAPLGDQASGMIVSAARSAAGPWMALAVLQTAHAQAVPYHHGSPDGPQLTLLTLPYAVN